MVSRDQHSELPAEEPGAVGIGGRQVPRAGVKGGRDRGTTILTVNDIEKIGIDKTIEIALEVAWKGAIAVYLSFDIDSVDAGFVPGTGWPEPGGLLPREARSSSRGSRRKGSSRWSRSRCRRPTTSPTSRPCWVPGSSWIPRRHGQE